MPSYFERYLESTFPIKGKVNELTSVTPYLNIVPKTREQHINFLKDYILFGKFLTDFYPKLRRINKFYFDKNFDSAKKEARVYIPITNDIELIKGLSQLNELFFIPLLNHTFYSYFREILREGIEKAYTKNRANFIELIKEFYDSSYLFHLQKQSWEFFEKIIDKVELIRPLVPFNYTQEENIADYDISSKSFKTIRNLYTLIPGN
jgi:hypothetical protein